MRVFMVRIVYKSGYTHDFEVENFEVQGGTYKWKAYGVQKPLQLGADEIVAVWQIGFREV